MKRLARVCFLGVWILFGAALPAAGEEAAKGAAPGHGTFLFAGAGLALPMSPEEFQDLWTAGYAIGAGVGFGLSPQFTVLVEGAWNNFHLDGSKTSGVGGDIKDLLLMAGLKYGFLERDKPLVPYGTLGAGFAIYDAQPVTFLGVGQTTGLNSTQGAFRLGAGVDIALDPGTALFVEGNAIFTSTGETGITYGVLRLGVLTDIGSVFSKSPGKKSGWDD